MKKVALISCSKYKKDYLESNNTKDVQLFNLSYEYAKKYADEIYILSPRYGLLKEGEYLSSYNEYLDYMSDAESKLWAMNIMDKLIKYSDIHEDKYIILASKNYYKNFEKYLKNSELPFLDLSFEECIAFLSNSINEKELENINYAHKLHSIFNSMTKYNIDNLDDIPFTNGVYVILDREEMYLDMKRIVAIGTHIGENRLIVDIKKHFKHGAKDESSLRKNIGLAILNYNNLAYCNIWNYDFTKEENIEKFSHLRNLKIENNLEKMISHYINERFEIVCFEIIEEKKRNRIVEGIKSCIVKDDDFSSSKKWLGNYSNIENIRKSFMWIDENFDKNVLSEKEMKEIIESSTHKE